jgi:hypothetical protein
MLWVLAALQVFAYLLTSADTRLQKVYIFVQGLIVDGTQNED